MAIKSILYVCLGNICRSPLGEAIAKDIAKKNNLDLIIDSAGTGSWHVGETPCSDSQKIARQHNIDISSYRARQVTKEDFEKFDLIIGLDKSNVQNLKNLGCKEPILLGDYGFDGEDVPDPYFFNGFEGFDKVYDMIEICTKNLFKQKILN